MGRWRKILLGALSLLLVFTLFGFFVLPPLLKSVAMDKLSVLLHRPVSIARIHINPYELSLQVEGLRIGEREDEATFIGFERLFVDVEATALLQKALVLSEFRLEQPTFRVVRGADQRYNFSDLVEEFLTPDKAEDAASDWTFSLHNLQIAGGSLEIEDQLMRARHVLDEIQLSLPFLSNRADAIDSFVEPAFSARIDGTRLQIQGKSKPFADSLESEMALVLNDLQLPQYLAYLPLELPLRLKSGALDTDIKLLFKQEKGKGASLRASGTAAVREVAIQDKSGAALLAFKRLNLALDSADILARRFEVQRLALEAPVIHARLDRQGVLNWATLVPKDKATAAPASPKAVDAASPGVTWTLNELAVTGASVYFADESRHEPVKLEIAGMDVGVRHLESSGTVPVALETRFRLGRRGEVALTGTLQQQPTLKAEMNVDLKTLELLPLQPYFSERLNIALTSGQLSVQGNVNLQQADAAAKGREALGGSFSGQVTLGDFQSVDKLNSADFLRWKSFFLDKVEVRLNPLAVNIGEMALSDFFARVIVSPAGKLNLLQIVRQDDAPAALADAPPVSVEKPAEVPPSAAVASAPVEASSQAPLPIQIGKMTLQGGNVRFTDNFIKPNYTANLRKIAGRIEGISSAPGTTAKLELRGSYDDIAPLTIDARVNLLAAKPYLDLQAEVKGVEMTSFSPYSGKYAGYAIEKGKLSVFVNYKIEDDQLQAENRLFLDQLTFGERVESPEATSLPVNLALALLKNRRGEIDLNLPIAGSLSDPQFSVGGLVVKMIVNLLVKAVTSPFALIGSLFGSGEELSNIEFAFGQVEILPEAEKRLENLSKALVERPGLRLEIAARIDAENDPEGLKLQRIRQKLKAIKRDALARKGVESGSLDSMTLTEEEYPGLLEKAYKAETFPKPRNAIGLVKSLPVEEMEKLMLTHATIDDDDLRELGDERARMIRDWLVMHEVPASRIFLLPSKMDNQPDGEKKLKASRADFSLK